MIQQDLFSSQNVSKSKDAAVPPSKLPKSVSLFDDEDEEVNVIATQIIKCLISRKLLLMELYSQRLIQ